MQGTPSEPPAQPAANGISTQDGGGASCAPAFHASASCLQGTHAAACGSGELNVRSGSAQKRMRLSSLEASERISKACAAEAKGDGNGDERSSRSSVDSEMVGTEFEDSGDADWHDHSRRSRRRNGKKQL